MVRDRKKIEEMASVIEVTYEVAQRYLLRIKQKEEHITEQIGGLLKRKKSTSFIQEDAASVYHVGADILWQQWADLRIEKLNLDLARVRAEKPTAVLSLRKCFQKKEALRKILECVTADEQATNSSVYES